MLGDHIFRFIRLRIRAKEGSVQRKMNITRVRFDGKIEYENTFEKLVVIVAAEHDFNQR